MVPHSLWAQEAPADTVSEEPVNPPADNAPDDPKLAEAKQRFAQGVALEKAGNCEGAISELRASYELVPRTNTLYNIAHCHEDLFQYSLAIEVYEQFLAAAEPDDPERRSVESTIKSLRNLLGTVSVDSNIEADIWLGKQKIGQAPGEILIPGGRHVIELRAQGFLPTRQEVVIAGRETAQLTFKLIKAQKKIVITKSRGLPPVYFWSGTAVTGLTLATGVFFGLRAKLEDSAARDLDPRLPKDEQREDIETLANVADLFFIGAGVLAVGTAVTFFLTDWQETPRTGQNTMGLTPQVSGEFIGLGLSGRW